MAGGSRVIVNGTDATGLDKSENAVRYADDPGRAYNAALEKDFDGASTDSQSEFLSKLQGSGAVKIEASPKIATSISRSSDGRIQCFFANFAGLVGGVNPVQTPQSGVKVTFASHTGSKGFFLPFMGAVQPVEGGRSGDSVSFTLPTITKGAVFWVEP